jgi:hypothetical protein
MRTRELPEILQYDKPSFETLKHFAVRQLADEANTIVALIDLVKNLKGVREPEKWAEHYSLDEWVRLINTARYKEARLWLLNHQV